MVILCYACSKVPSEQFQGRSIVGVATFRSSGRIDVSKTSFDVMCPLGTE